MIHQLPILAVVLCGGKSTRMGADKGLLAIQQTTWAQFVADKAILAQLPVVYSISTQQISSYSQQISKHLLLPDDDDLQVQGPLKGLLSVHKAYPNHHVLLLSCDMLHTDITILQQLIQHSFAHPAAHFWAFITGTFAQPFCAIYSAYGLQQQLQKQSSINNFSLQGLLKQVTTAFIATDHEHVFYSYNTPILGTDTWLQNIPTFKSR